MRTPYRERRTKLRQLTSGGFLFAFFSLLLLRTGQGFAPGLVRKATVRRPLPLSSPRLPETPVFLGMSQTKESTVDASFDTGIAFEDEKSTYAIAVKRTLLWVGLSFAFGGFLWGAVDPVVGEEFFAGYLVEQSLSVDNLFVFLLLFEYFQVPTPLQRRVLDWGIYGAIVMRAAMISVGAAALQQFHGILLVFASILIYSSGQFFIGGDDDEEDDPSQNAIVKFARNLFPSTDEYDGKNFFTIQDGIRKATPLFICMVAVEVSDIVFAVDSIPAVFGVTENPLVVFSSNMFAIMGLRSMYTILSKAATDLKYLEPAVALVLGFIGSKMVAEYFDFCIPTNVALTVVASLLAAGVGASVLDKKAADEAASD